MANIINEFEIKKQMCEIGRRMYEKGFVAANDGNISYRLGKGRYLCTPTLVSKGFLKPSDIAVVDEKGKQLEGQLPRTSEILLHLEIFHALPEINAVCHAHPPYATAFAVAGIEVPSNILPEVEIFIGQVPLADYDTPGSKSFAETILPHLRNKANTILLANHGAVVLRQGPGAGVLPLGDAGHVLPHPAAWQAGGQHSPAFRGKGSRAAGDQEEAGHRRPAD